VLPEVASACERSFGGHQKLSQFLTIGMQVRGLKLIFTGVDGLRYFWRHGDKRIHKT